VSAEHSLTLIEGLHAPSHARAWTSERTPQLPRATAEDTLLIVSELVTNAVRHGRPEIVLHLELTGDRVRIEVQDGSDELPLVPADQPAVDRLTGRGLLIVAATASDWGIARLTGRSGKTVWAELRFDPDPNFVITA
jgi:anti-sigma regulatory factor (Ser/Thr protein kinase)